MPWYSCIVCFLAGVILTDGVPHFVKGICGEPFPATFAKPGVPVNRSSFTGWKSSDKGLSSPIVNVLEGILDFIVGAVLLTGGGLSIAHRATLIAFLAGVTLTGVLLSHQFGKQHAR
jgi:hypothetical protein